MTNNGFIRRLCSFGVNDFVDMRKSAVSKIYPAGKPAGHFLFLPIQPEACGILSPLLSASPISPQEKIHYGKMRGLCCRYCQGAVSIHREFVFFGLPVLVIYGDVPESHIY